MAEQILNLLPHKFRKVHVPFDHRQIIAAIVGTFVVIGTGVAGLAFFDARLDTQLSAAQDHNTQMVQAVDEFKANNSKKTLDETMAVRISKYEDTLRQRQNFLKKLNGESFGNTRGFTEYLLALSRQKFPDIWIEELLIVGEARIFSMKGKAVQPTDIPLYLQSLQSEPAMRGIIFDDLTLDRQKQPEGDFVSFSISFGGTGGLGLGNNKVSRILSDLNVPEFATIDSF